MQKPQIQKALESLTASGKLTCVDNGKSKVWLAAQGGEVASPEELAALERELNELGNQVKDAKTKNAALQNELRSMGSTKSVAQMEAEATSLLVRLMLVLCDAMC